MSCSLKWGLLDAFYWGPEWTPRAGFQLHVSAAVARQRWVIDGNYSAVRHLIWRRATAIVWLDYSFGRVFGRALRRTARRVLTGERLYGGNRETIHNALLDRVTGSPGGSCALMRSGAVSFPSSSDDRSIVRLP